jgi:hypothetical protein
MSAEAASWIIQRCTQQWIGASLQYEDWPGYCEKLLSYDEMIEALKQCDQRWPEHEFRGHSVIDAHRTAAYRKLN